MKLALVSPLPPARSGIADFAATLAAELMEGTSILVDSYTQHQFTVKEHESHDITLYQMGNNAVFHGKMHSLLQELPGIVELHDLTLHNMVAGMTVPENRREEYIAEYQYVYGDWGAEVGRLDWDNSLQLWETRPNMFPMLARVLDSALAVIVHSQAAAAIVRQHSATIPCWVIPLMTRVIERRYYSLPRTSIRISSFGQVQRNKQVPETFQALARLASRYSFSYTLVGSSSRERDYLLRIATQYGIRDRVEFIGRVSRDVLLDSIAGTDITLNLRHPTHGETSAALLDCFSVGTAAIVTNAGWYAELPEEVCLKVSPSAVELPAVLARLLTHPNVRNDLAANSRAWVRERHGPPAVTRLYEKVLRTPYSRARINGSRYARRVVRSLNLPPNPLLLRSLQRHLGSEPS